MKAGPLEMTQCLESVPPPSGEPGSARDATIDLPGTLNAAEQDCLMLNLDASLRVHSRPHFFSWTQGVLQSLIHHEALVCAVRSSEQLSLTVDSFSTGTPDATVFSESFQRDAPVAPALVKAWEERRFRPVVCAVQDVPALTGGAFARELERIGATRLVVHGVHDGDGVTRALFVFSCAPGTDPRRQSYVAQLVVPFLHAAWMRSRLNGQTRGHDASRSGRAGTITSREQEILKWIYLGKSNFEIGAILNISPLTVKNHVQKILRKLNVVNRAQAVGKGLELRILNP